MFWCEFLPERLAPYDTAENATSSQAINSVFLQELSAQGESLEKLKAEHLSDAHVRPFRHFRHLIGRYNATFANHGKDLEAM